jgi:Leucine-rich repeat (LRR) protein
MTTLDDRDYYGYEFKYTIGDDIEEYLNCLPEDIEEINIANNDITYLPELNRFKKLKSFNCRDNQITRLPRLPKTLELLFCQNNKLTCLPVLPKNLKSLNCSHNKIKRLTNLPEKLITLQCHYNELTYLPELPKNLEIIYCYNNRINCLPKLPYKLKVLYTSNNNLTSLPILPKSLYHLDCGENDIQYLPPLPDHLGYFNYSNIPLFDVLIHNLNSMNPYPQIKKNVNILNNCRNMIYAIKFKKQFREWLWLRVREPKIREKYHPKYFLNLKEEDDLDIYLNNW